MTPPGDTPPDALADAILAARLCAIDPALGGLALRGGDTARDIVIDALRHGLPEGAPIRRIPAHIDDERLLGGIDLTATLARGSAVARIGLLAEANGGAVILPMAERLSDATAARIAAVQDNGELAVERDGATLRGAARFVAVALDDGIEPDERPPAALMERIAFWIDLTTIARFEVRSLDIAGLTGNPITVRPELVEGPFFSAAEKRTMLRQAQHERSVGGSPKYDSTSDDANPTPPLQVTTNHSHAITTIATTAAALGIDSARASLFALRAARAAATLAGRTTIADEDLLLAARLVLAPRATRMPMAAEEPPAEEPPPPPPDTESGAEERGDPGQIDDIVLAAALAALPRDVLARIAAGSNRRGPAAHARGGGERRKSPLRGRPMGARPGVPGGGLRLSLIDTLRAAAPWQKLRGGGEGRILIRRDDLRIRRFETRAEAVTIFAVDASGSSALARLAEAKGAVELLLAEAYVKRAQVALVAFRGATAEILLPPTRSLARARRSLAELPGGGGSPLAAGLDAARGLAEAARARGRTPFVVVLTDGRANIAADGRAVRSLAETDATAAARAIGTAGLAAVFVDISTRPRPENATLAAAMGARYLPLPRADAAAMHAAVSMARRG